MKLGRVSAIAAAGVIAVGTLVGITGAGTASASETTPNILCTFAASNGTGSICAYAHGSSAIGMIPKVAGVTKWYYVDNSNYGKIQEAGTNNCMQLDQADGYIVREASCSTTSDSVLWANVYNEATHRTEFVSMWTIASSLGDYCLSYDKDGGILKADPCGGGTNYWYQQFASS